MFAYFKLIWNVVQKIYSICMTRRFFASVNHQICCGFPEMTTRNITRIINLLTVTGNSKFMEGTGLFLCEILCAC